MGLFGCGKRTDSAQVFRKEKEKNVWIMSFFP